MTFDEARRAHPHLGMALYALEPGGAVTLEIVMDQDVFSFRGSTAEECLQTAFPTGQATEEDPFS